MRIELAKKFAKLRGFETIAETLNRSDLIWPGSDVIFHLISTMMATEIAGSVEQSTKTAILNASMAHLLNLPDEVLKRENTDSLSNLIRTIGNLFYSVFEESLPSSREETYHKFCFQIVMKCITSSSLVTKLFGYEQLNDLISDIKAYRPIAGSFIVQNAGTEFINGLYIVDRKQNFDSDHYQYVKESDDPNVPLLTLFRCTMRNTKAKWWFISQADLEKPGTDKDIDYYLHRSTVEDEREPPTYGWQRSNAGMKVMGEDPVPILRRGRPFFRDENQEVDKSIDYSFLRWALAEDEASNIIHLLFTVSNMHREIISRAEKFLVFVIEYDALTEKHVAMMWKAMLTCHDMDIVEELLVLMLHLLPLLNDDLQRYFVRLLNTSLMQQGDGEDCYHKLMLFAEKMSLDSFKYINMISNPLTFQSIITFTWQLFRHPLFEAQKNNGHVMDLLAFCFSQPIGRAMAIEKIEDNLELLTRYASQATSSLSVEEEIGKALNILSFIISKLMITSDMAEDLDRACNVLIDEVNRFLSMHRRSPLFIEEDFVVKLSSRLQVFQRYLHNNFQLYPKDGDEMLLSTCWQGVCRIFNLVVDQPMELQAFFAFLKAFYHSNTTTFSAQTGVIAGSAAGGIGSSSSGRSARHLLHYRIFVDFLCNDKVSWVYLQELAFDCFSVYFGDLEYFNNVFVQLSDGERQGSEPPVKLAICTLWRMVFNVIQPTAANAAIDLLMTAYEGLADANNRIFTPQEILNIIFAQLEVCVICFQSPECLPEGSSSGPYDQYINSRVSSVTHATWLSVRSLQILQQAIQKFSNGKLLSHLACTNTSRWTLQVAYKRVSYSYNSVTNHNVWRTEKGTDGFIKVNVHPYHTVKQLKSKIIEMAGLESNIRITFDHLHPATSATAGATVTTAPDTASAITDSMCLHELGLQDNQEVSVSYEIIYSHNRSYSDDIYRSNYPYNSYQNPDDSMVSNGSQDAYTEKSDSLGAILAEDYSKFDILLTLCQCAGEQGSSELKDRIWEILMLIPTQSNLLDMIQNVFEDNNMVPADDVPLEEVHVVNSLAWDEASVWSRFIANPSSPRTAYMLQLLSICINPAPELDLLKPASEPYRQLFVHHKGMEVLLGALQALPHKDDSIVNASYAVLLGMIHYLLMESKAEVEEAPELDDSMLSTGFWRKIPVSLALSDVDNGALIQQLLFATHLAACKGKSEMVECALYIIMNALQHSQAMSTILTGSSSARELIKLVLTNSNQRVREMAINFVYALGRFDRVVSRWVIEEVLSDDVYSCAHCVELFTACKTLIGEKEEIPGIDIPTLCKDFRARVLYFRDRNMVEAQTLQLQGYLDLYGHVLRLYPSVITQQNTEQREEHKTFIDQLLKHYLFYFPGTDPAADAEAVVVANNSEKDNAVCNNPPSRSAAFGVLLAYARCSSQYFEFIVEEVQRLVRATAKHLTHAFNIQISYDIKTASIPHTGLKNQGCTCYLNSLLQLLYGSASFREQLLALPIKAIHRSTVWHLDALDIVGSYVLCEYSVPSGHLATDVGQGADFVVIYGSPWRLGKCIGYDADTSSHRVQYFNLATSAIDEVAHFSLHNGRFNKETGRVKVLPLDLLVLPPLSKPVDSPEYVRAVMAALQASSASIWCLSDKEEAALRVVEQLQRTFVYLKRSQRKYYDPRPLVEACKSLNLNYNIYHQNDAAEFYDQLLDRIEMVAKSKEITGDDLWAKIFSKEVFGGEYITQKIPQDCPAYRQNKEECGHHQSARKEMFLKIELLIRGKDDINDSLRELVASEVFDGENKISCDVCNEKKTTTRFTCLDTLPNVLILHLKRFDLDFNTFETVKLNTKLAFPVQMNLYPYTKEGIDDERRRKEREAGEAAGEEVEEAIAAAAGEGRRREDCEYELQGILVHAGIAQGGHYYSFVQAGSGDLEAQVKEALRTAPSTAEEAAISGKWFRFDDEDVSPFDPEHIPYHCFGGPAHTGGSTFADDERSANALMLLYSKSSPQLSAALTSALSSPSSKTAGFISGNHAFGREVQEANLEHLLTCYLVDPELHLFLTSLLRQLVPDQNPSSLLWAPSSKNSSAIKLSEKSTVDLDDSAEDNPLRTMEVIVRYLFDVLLHIRERPALRNMLSAIKEIFQAYNYTAYWFLYTVLSSSLNSSNAPVGWFNDYLIHCSDALARNTFVQVCVDACTVLCGSISAQALRVVNSMKMVELKQAVMAGSVIALAGLFVKSVVDVVFRIPAHSRTADEIFVLIRDLSNIPSVMHSLQSIGMVSYLCYFIVPDLVAPTVVNIFERSAGVAKQQVASMGHSASSSFKDFSHLHGSVFEAIAGILGVPMCTRVNLLQEKSYWDAELTIEAREALTIIFEESSRAGVMDSYDLTTYIDKVTPASAYPYATTGTAGRNHSVTVRNLMDRYGMDGKLRLEGFLQFHADTASYNPKAVWKDLQAFGFQNDLSRRTDAGPAAVNLATPATVAAPLSITEACRACLSHLSFYEQGLVGCEVAARAIAQRVCRNDEKVSHSLISEAIHRLLAISSETSWTPNAALVIHDFLRLLLSIDDGLMLKRLQDILLDKNAGFIEVIVRER